ncbi:unnamed protein product, partial [Ectocarpus fasciculatus]
ERRISRRRARGTARKRKLMEKKRARGGRFCVVGKDIPPRALQTLGTTRSRRYSLLFTNALRPRTKAAQSHFHKVGVVVTTYSRLVGLSSRVRHICSFLLWKITVRVWCL